MQQLNDPDLGTIHFDDRKYYNVWTLDRRASFNGHDIPIKIEPEDSETLAISEVQRQATKIALNLTADTLLLSAPAVIQNYECYEEDLNGNKLLKLTSLIDIWNLVEPSCISIPAHSSPPYLRC